MQPTPHPPTLQPALTPGRPLTVEELEDVDTPVMRVAELAPAVREPPPELPTPCPSAPHVTVAPSTGALVAKTLAPLRTVAAPATASRKSLLTWNRVGFTALVVMLYLGWSLPTERYMTPTRGFGYALGIIGGSLMLLLLLYSARKHFRWLRFLGPTAAWFRFHMMLGILGPLCILFHSNFRTGAANSNVALFCMLTVAGSGFFGRYLYAHIHHGLYGRNSSSESSRPARQGCGDLREP